MNTVTYRNLILAAAAMAVSVTPTFAQGATPKLKANVPFSFHVGSHEYPAGTYSTTVIENTTSARIVRLVNEATGKAALIQAMNLNYSSKMDSEAKLAFQCADSTCALAQLWLGNGRPGIQFLTPRTKPGEAMKLAVIRLLPTSAD